VTAFFFVRFILGDGLEYKSNGSTKSTKATAAQRVQNLAKNFRVCAAKNKNEGNALETEN